MNERLDEFKRRTEERKMKYAGKQKLLERVTTGSTYGMIGGFGTFGITKGIEIYNSGQVEEIIYDFQNKGLLAAIASALIGLASSNINLNIAERKMLGWARDVKELFPEDKEMNQLADEQIKRLTR